MSLDTGNIFDMEDYRRHILAMLGWDPVLFSEITPLAEDDRTDRVGRFITLVFMDNEQEVDLTQNGADLLVQKRYNEAHA